VGAGADAARLRMRMRGLYQAEKEPAEQSKYIPIVQGRGVLDGRSNS
jgi:hypothetical protein